MISIIMERTLHQKQILSINRYETSILPAARMILSRYPSEVKPTRNMWVVWSRYPIPTEVAPEPPFNPILSAKPILPNPTVCEILYRIG